MCDSGIFIILKAQIQTEQISDKKILRIGILLVVYEDIDDAGKGEGILHGCSPIVCGL